MISVFVILVIIQYITPCYDFDLTRRSFVLWLRSYKVWFRSSRVFCILLRLGIGFLRVTRGRVSVVMTSHAVLCVISRRYLFSVLLSFTNVFSSENRSRIRRLVAAGIFRTGARSSLIPFLDYRISNAPIIVFVILVINQYITSSTYRYDMY